MKKNRVFFTQQYLENRPAFFGLIRPIEAQLIYQNKKKLKNKILDFGCGDGFFANLVFDSKEIEVGIDVHDSRIHEASVKKCYQKLQTYDGQRLPYPAKFFSGVFSNSVLEHVPSLDLDGNIHEIYRVLKTGGYFLTTVMTLNWDHYLWGKIFFGKRYSQWLKKNQVHHNLLTDKQWQEKFEKAGFVVEKKVGYLNKRASHQMELWHYLSVLSMLTHVLFQSWVPWKKWYQLFHLDQIFEKLNACSFVDSSHASSVFFVLKKKK